ncbi:hypothetical protein BpHYR1_027755 [Brachionus plicatilis]|uniref:Uncharacterized protein n=1 Tax=Brachionus plicatilis TaxID=10195 RepID=A0A3M7SV04_BRAPC|nr:hypothetical protein BpHYR1_027755 [Brachionus plicatilis]
MTCEYCYEKLFLREITRNYLIINNKQKCKNKNVFYGVNAHENNHLLNEKKSSNRASLELTLFTMNENINKLNTNVSKLNSETEAIKKLITGGETNSSFFSPGTKRKAERTYSSSSDSEAIETIINNKPFTNRLRSEIMKRFVNDKGQTLGFYEKKFHNEMEEIKKDLLKLVPINSISKNHGKKLDQKISKKSKNAKILKKSSIFWNFTFYI